MRTPLSEMTDDELISACQEHPWGKRLEDLGCVSGIALGVGVGVFAYRVSGGAWNDVLASAVFTIIAFAIIQAYLMGLWTRKYKNELGRRHVFPASKATHEKIRGLDGPDWIFLLRGQGLPHGDACYVEVCLWLTPELHGNLLRKQQTPIYRIGSRPFKSDTGNVELSAATCVRFRSIFDHLSLEDMKDAKSFVIDGFPCTIIAIRKQPFGTGQGKCNLAGISQAEAELPVPKLAMLLWETAQAVPMSPSIIGSCDFRGNVKVEEL